MELFRKLCKSRVSTGGYPMCLLCIARERMNTENGLVVGFLGLGPIPRRSVCYRQGNN